MEDAAIIPTLAFSMFMNIRSCRIKCQHALKILFTHMLLFSVMSLSHFIVLSQIVHPIFKYQVQREHTRFNTSCFMIVYLFILIFSSYCASFVTEGLKKKRVMKTP